MSTGTDVGFKVQLTLDDLIQVYADEQFLPHEQRLHELEKEYNDLNKTYHEYLESEEFLSFLQNTFIAKFHDVYYKLLNLHNFIQEFNLSHGFYYAFTLRHSFDSYRLYKDGTISSDWKFHYVNDRNWNYDVLRYLQETLDKNKNVSLIIAVILNTKTKEDPIHCCIPFEDFPVNFQNIALAMRDIKTQIQEIPSKEEFKAEAKKAIVLNALRNDPTARQITTGLIQIDVQPED